MKKHRQAERGNNMMKKLKSYLTKDNILAFLSTAKDVVVEITSLVVSAKALQNALRA